MKRLIIILLVFTGVSLHMNTMCAQINLGQVSVSPVVANDDIPAEAERLLISKLNGIISQNGYGSLSETQRFVLVANVNVINKDIVPSSPPRISSNYEITFILGDVIENLTFGTCVLQVAGIGTNETKAYNTAISQVDIRSKALSRMFDEARSRIEAYYSDSSLFLKKARTLAETGQFSQAIAYLMTIPPIDDKAFSLCQEEIISIYQNKIDKEGLALYNKAFGIWQSSRNLNGAKTVAEILNEIDPYSSVMPKVDVLWKDISEKLRVDELAMIESQKRQHEERMKEIDATQQTVGKILDVAKAVGVAFGVFQPRIVVNRIVRRWF